MSALAVPRWNGAALPPGIVEPGEPFIPPAHLWIPEHVSSAVEEGVDLLASVGRTLDAEQRLALHAMYAEQPDGNLAAFEFGLVVARQQMKSYTLEAAALIDLFLVQEPLCIWTAHVFSTTLEAFNNLKNLVINHDHLRREVLRMPEGKGDQAIETRSGARLLFRARGRTSIRGISADKLTLDEGLFLEPAEVGSVLPTMAARPNPQVRYAGSAGMATSAVLRNLRDRGRAGGDPSMAWLEWGAPGTQSHPGCVSEHCTHKPGTHGCALDDQRLWRMALPALGRRMTLARLEAFRRTMTWQEFAREFLSWWDEPSEGTERALDAQAWQDRVDPTSYALDPLALCVDVTPRQSAAAVALAGWRPRAGDADRVDATGTHRGRRKHVELAVTGGGVTWVVDWLVQRVRDWAPVAVAIDGSSPAAALLPSLRAALVDADLDPDDLIVVMGARDTAAAAAMLDVDVREDGMRHPGATEAATAVTDATWRPLAGGRAFARAHPDADISPVVAMAGASWALVARRPPDSAPPPPPLGLDRPSAPESALLAGELGGGYGIGVSDAPGRDVMSMGF